MSEETTNARTGRNEPPGRFMIDGRLFRFLCSSGETAALEGFRSSIARHGLAPEGGLPAFELTPLVFLDAVGVQPPRYEVYPLPASILRECEDTLTLTTLIVKVARDFYAKAPDLQASSLSKRVEKLRERADPAAHELIDLCLTRFVSRQGFENDIHGHLAFDFVYRFRFPEEVREEIFDFLALSLFAAGESVSGLSKIRVVKALWHRSSERLLRKHPAERAAVQALGREMGLKNYREFLAWEILHHSILGYGTERIQPVTAFTPDPEETIKARCSAYKSALRAFLDQVSHEDLVTTLKPALQSWRPGVVVPCRKDGTFDALVSTGDLPVY